MAKTKWQRKWRQFEVRLQRNPKIQAVLHGFYRWYMGFVARTTRWEEIGVQSYGPNGDFRPKILCLWHGHLACGPTVAMQMQRDVTVLASDHADAQILVAYLNDLGMQVIPLKTSGDNTTAVKQAVRHVRRGGTLGVTPDGPMGPAREVKPGAITIAALAQAELVPCSFAINRAFRLGTWDKFIVPLPFGRGVLGAFPGFTPPRDLDAAGIAQACHRLSRALDDVSAACEARLKAGKNAPKGKS
ncbi:MAG: lysophospholipid acyltransferase family protein [Mangrovicoccus sp.]